METNRQENAASMEKELGRRFYFVKGSDEDENNERRTRKDDH